MLKAAAAISASTVKRSTRKILKSIPSANELPLSSDSSPSDALPLSPPFLTHKYTHSVASLIPEIQPVSSFTLSTLPTTLESDSSTLSDHLCLFNAHLRQNNTGLASQILFRLHRHNHASFASSPEIGPWNALIEGYLQLNTLSTTNTSLSTVRGEKCEFDEAYTIYSHLSQKYNLTPTTDTFALFTTHYIAQNAHEKMQTLLKDMKRYGVSVLSVIEHYRFQNPIDLARLVGFLKECGCSIDVEVEKCEQDALLLSAIEESLDTTPAYSPTSPIAMSYSQRMAQQQIEDTEDTLHIIPSDSANIQHLSRTLARFNMQQHEKNLYTLQESLEKESKNLAIIEQEGLLDTMPTALLNFAGPSKTMILDWYNSLIPFIESELSTPTDLKHHPYLSLLSASKLALLTITQFLHTPNTQEIKAGQVYGRQKFASLTIAIGKSIEDEINADILLKHTKQSSNTSSTLSRTPTTRSKGVGSGVAGADGASTSKRMYEAQVKAVGDPRSRQLIMALARKQLERDAVWAPRWSDHILAGVGGTLSMMLVLCAKIRVKGEDWEPIRETEAFHHTFISEHGKKIGVIAYNPELLTQLLTAPTPIPPKFLPMLVPPRPWITWKEGGYLTPFSKAEMARVGKHPSHKRYLDAADASNLMSPLYHALDCLGQTPWRINKPILTLIKQCWNTREPFPGIPSGHKLPVSVYKRVDGDTVRVDVEKRKVVRIEKSKEMNRYSQRCDANYKILIADSFKDETIYFPHFVDFRGRGYPTPQYLNHIGNDLCRGLLVFAEKKALGERGLKWLKIQVANLYGVDKVSFTDRERFVEDHLDEIFDSADNPLTGRRWWLAAEDPWQTLATCMELAAALRSPVPTLYRSNLPIHQDGTCNGLQHYAALGGDLAGAKLVNLVPGERPADVYTGVSDRVSESIKQDALNGSKLAIKLNGHITRKIVKQTVMTNTYGVTRIGAQKQVYARLKDVKALSEVFTESEYDQASKLITVKIFEAMESLFEGARGLQNWLTESANAIARSVPGDSLNDESLVDTRWCEERGLLKRSFSSDECDERFEVSEAECGGEDGELTQAAITDTSPDQDIAETQKKDKRKAKKKKIDAVPRMTSVVWTSALGLPIVQPYFSHQLKLITTTLQSISLYDHSLPAPVDPRKQSQSFPPNYIHSLDAAHMQLSAIACKSAGVEFAAVHDSYWTHSGDVDRMAEVLREAFVRLHSEDLMSRLRQEFVQRYRGYKQQSTIELKAADLAAYLIHRKSIGKRCRVKANATEGEDSRLIKVWRPMEIGELPKKGGFNVEIVKQSLYFFH